MQNPEKLVSKLSSFKDVKNNSIRTRNQAIVMVNLFEDNLNKKNTKVNSRGASAILNYFSKIPNEDKDSVLSQYRDIMSERGFVGV